MKILITGGTGFIGKRLVEKLQSEGHEIVILSRKEEIENNIFSYSIKNQEINPLALENLDGIIHLAGATVSERWTKNYKQEILHSRTQILKLLREKLEENQQKISFVISASGVNYYGTQTSEQIYKEEAPSGTDFLAQVCVEWEREAQQFKNISKQITILRTGVVLGENGGAIAKMKPLFKRNLGSVLGSGKQWFPWISLEDLTDMYVFCVENKVDGIYNALNSNHITQKEFTHQLAKTLRKNIILPPTPSFILKMILGEMSEILLKGSRISNQKIKDLGFECKENNLTQIKLN